MMTTMKTINLVCDECGKQSEVAIIRRLAAIEFRGSSYEVEEEVAACPHCGEEYLPIGEVDPLKAVYRQYRKAHGLMQPDEISELRNRLGLTQKDVANVIGCGHITISRYENGALQTDAHDRLLRLLDAYGVQGLEAAYAKSRARSVV